MATLRASTTGGRSGRFSDVRSDPDVRRLRRDDGEQRPGVEERRLVGVVLEADEVEADEVGQLRELDDAVGVGGGRA